MSGFRFLEGDDGRKAPFLPRVQKSLLLLLGCGLAHSCTDSLQGMKCTCAVAILFWVLCCDAVTLLPTIEILNQNEECIKLHDQQNISLKFQLPRSNSSPRFVHINVRTSRSDEVWDYDIPPTPHTTTTSYYFTCPASKSIFFFFGGVQNIAVQ